MENKWWEYYAVRYFVGTVVGAVLVAFLTQKGQPFAGKLDLGNFTSGGATFLGVSLMAALGFAYCYIASAPILTLHSARAHLHFSMLRKSGGNWVGSGLRMLIAVGVSILMAWLFMPPFAASLTGIIIGFQVGLVWLVLQSNFSVVETFYRGLATTRAGAMPEKDGPPTAGSEYITSYRHMREHGNAFMIVLLEGVLAFTLFNLQSSAHVFFLLSVWLLPATIAWVLGSVLESRLVATPLLPRRKLLGQAQATRQSNQSGTPNDSYE